MVSTLELLAISDASHRTSQQRIVRPVCQSELMGIFPIPKIPTIVLNKHANVKITMISL